MNPRDLAAVTNPARYPDLPRVPGTVTGEQTKHGAALIRLSWPDIGKTAWVDARDLIPVAKRA